MAWDYAAENARLNAENERRQEQLRQERMQREMLDLERRRTWAAERQDTHSGILGLLLLIGLIVGFVWVVIWLLRGIWRVAGRKRNGPTTHANPEQEPVDLLRRHDIDPAVVTRAVRETLRRRGG
jgi:hypothetical protein